MDYSRPTQQLIDYVTYYRDKHVEFVKLKGVTSVEFPDRAEYLQIKYLCYDIIITHPTVDEQTKMKLARMEYNSEVGRWSRMQQIREEINRDLVSKNLDQMKWYFITVGYDDQLITDRKINELTKKLTEKPFFTEVRYVNEKYRRGDDGQIYVHHHLHLLVISELPKSKIIQYIYGTVKLSVKGQQAVDVKSYKQKDVKQTYAGYLKYINGEKTEKKMECVEMDRKWRIENNII